MSYVCMYVHVVGEHVHVHVVGEHVHVHVSTCLYTVLGPFNDNFGCRNLNSFTVFNCILLAIHIQLQ